MSASHNSPPAELDRDLEVGPDDWPPSQFYHLLTGMVVPRPIGWISTISAQGSCNLAPYSFFNAMGSDPFYVVFGSVSVKDTLANLQDVPEFVCNIPSMDLIDRVEFTAADFPPGEDELSWAKLTPMSSVKVRPHRVGEAKAHLECKVAEIFTDRNTHIVIGRVVHAHVVPSIWSNGRINPRLLDPLTRLGGSDYASLGNIFTVKRPQWNEISTEGAEAAFPRAVLKS